MSSIKHVSKATFANEVIHSAVPVLIDFYAGWCGPCRMLAPVLERLAIEFGGRAKIVKVNIDQEQELASQFQVQSIPTLSFVVDGKVAGQASGVLSESALRQALNHLATAAPAATRRVG